jgi:hypothetical protein
MSDYYFSIAAGNRRTLCISPLTRDELSSDDERNGSGLGYYLYARDESADGLTILAEIGSSDAACELFDLLRAVSRHQDATT